MRKIEISGILPGMILGKTIYSATGQILLNEDVVINDQYIARLKRIGILSVFIKDGLTDDVPIPDIIDDRTRIETQGAVKEIFSAFEKGRSIDLTSIKSLVNNIMDELLLSGQLIFDLTDIRTFDDFTFQHSVNVCILALIIGITLNYDQLKLRDLGMGALLHDIGKMNLNQELVNKSAKLSSDEFAEIQKHCTFGFEILRNYENVSIISAHVAFQHHENFDGTGYPRGLSGEQIHEYARIVAYCDVYDALIAERPYRKAYPPEEALDIIRESIGTRLDPKIADAFFKNVVIYPVGSIVQLNSREIGVIIKNNKEFLNQPVVRIILDRIQNRLMKPIDINLAENRAYEITRHLNDADPLIPSINALQRRIESSS